MKGLEQVWHLAWKIHFSFPAHWFSTCILNEIQPNLKFMMIRSPFEINRWFCWVLNKHQIRFSHSWFLHHRQYRQCRLYEQQRRRRQWWRCCMPNFYSPLLSLWVMTKIYDSLLQFALLYFFILLCMRIYSRVWEGYEHWS